MADDINKLIQKYKKFIANNPDSTTQVETIFRLGSYAIAGRFSDSPVLSELVYSASNLIVLLNDGILRKANMLSINVPVSQARLHTLLTVLEYVQVFIEMLATRMFGETGKWILVACIEITKAAFRFILLLKFKSGIQSIPPVPPLDRDNEVPKQNIKERNRDRTDPSHHPNSDQKSKEPVTVTLERSGRVIRTLEAAPPMELRTWTLPAAKKAKNTTGMEDLMPTVLNKQRFTGECLHITRPLAHLLSMYLFGQSSWKPWLVAGAMDVSSLLLMGDPKSLNPAERAELHRRTVMLLYYLLRSPFYDSQTQAKIVILLKILADNVPGTGIVLRPLLQYLPVWQKVYFYVWGS
ncbi:peroxisomal membrane protein PEX16-like isoform X1 [Lingula anatina]|uniref:Peroxisomal membrane protein PEX16 n=2 Tax=Lingula anatina TaxID=7574 RepID=A0A1S3JZ19_LINAN|nr:peroxisomal membrane protein PEX16-like isoform X1 [Lingula anatina]|eukprot:XP_013415638.1 peroxisomal membrane protein PEX16-like isoform X1 [Lingula anatina]